MQSASAVINITACRFRYPDAERPCIDIDAFRMERGEHLFVRGRSGSGKSTFLNLLCGILTPDEGNISVLGTNFTALSAARKDRFRADHFGIVFQQFNLLPHLNVERNITLACDFSARKRAAAAPVEKSVRTLLRRLDLDDALLHMPASELSVGQQQRVAVARALIGAPEILVADEPTSALDAEARDDFLTLLFDEARRHGTTVLFVSHDPALASYFTRSVDFAVLNGAAR